MALTINGTTGISGLDGSSSSPVIQGTDSNTGLSFGTDIVNINTGGTRRINVNSSGQVGIGCDAGVTLDVQSAGGSAGWQMRVKNVGGSNDSGFFRDANDHFECVLRNGSGGLSFIKNSSGASTASLEFTTQGSERMRINHNGKVIIGRTDSFRGASSNGLEVECQDAAVVSMRNSNTGSTSGGTLRSWRLGPENNNTIVLYNQSNVGQFMVNGSTSWAANSSDERVKDIVGTLDSALSWNVIKGLQIKKWWYKNEPADERTGLPHVGPIAQDLHSLDPDLRLDSPESTTAATFGLDFTGPVYTFDNDLLIKHGLNALRQAIAKIETLETKVAALEAA